MQHIMMDPLSEDYDKRVYVFNSQAIHLGNEAKFVVEANGERYIENAAPTIASEDFDFVSREPHSLLERAVKKGNDHYLIPNIDPLGIGRTVNISYPSHRDTNTTEYTQYIHDYAKAHGNYTKEKFEEDLARYEHEHSTGKGVINVIPAMSRVVDHLWESGTTKFLEKKGNVILYEKEGLDSVYDDNSNMKTYIQEHKDAMYHRIDENGTETFTEIPRIKFEDEQTQTPSPTNGVLLISSEYNSTHADNIIPADEKNQSSSLLPDDVAIPNAQIAEFDSNKDTQSQENEKGAYVIEHDILLSSEGYVIDEYAEEIGTMNNNDDDYGMER